MRNRWASLYKEYSDLTELDRRDKLAAFSVVIGFIFLVIFAISTLMIIVR
jgi:hypothetical protein